MNKRFLFSALVAGMALPLASDADIAEEFAALKEKGVIRYLGELGAEKAKDKVVDGFATDWGLDEGNPRTGNSLLNSVKDLKFVGTNVFEILSDGVDQFESALLVEPGNSTQSAEWLDANAEYEEQQTKHARAIVKARLPPGARDFVDRLESADDDATAIRSLPELAKAFGRRIVLFVRGCDDEAQCRARDELAAVGWGDAVTDSVRLTVAPTDSHTVGEPSGIRSRPSGHTAATSAAPALVDASVAPSQQPQGSGVMLVPKTTSVPSTSADASVAPKEVIRSANAAAPGASDAQVRVDPNLPASLKAKGLPGAQTSGAYTTQASRFSDTSPGSLKASVEAALPGAPAIVTKSDSATKTGNTTQASRFSDTKPGSLKASVEAALPGHPASGSNGHARLDPAAVSAALRPVPRVSHTTSANALSADLQTWDRKQRELQLARERAAREAEQRRLAELELAAYEREQRVLQAAEDRRREHEEARDDRAEERRERAEERSWQRERDEYLASLYGYPPDAVEHMTQEYARPAWEGVGDDCTQFPAFGQTVDPVEFQRKMECYLEYQGSQTEASSIYSSPGSTSSAARHDSTIEKNDFGDCALMNGNGKCVARTSSGRPTTSIPTPATSGSSSTSRSSSGNATK